MQRDGNSAKRPSPEGKPIGRPLVFVDAPRIATLRANGHPLGEIAAELGYSRSLAHKALANGESCGVAITTV